MLPVSVYMTPGTPSTSFSGLDSLVAPAVNASAVVSGPGSFVFDIAVASDRRFIHDPHPLDTFTRSDLTRLQESAAWIEFDSPDLSAADAARVQLSFAEWAANPLKTGPPVAYGTTYRLETNPQLYEGVRYGWFNMTEAPSQVRVACKSSSLRLSS